MHHGFFSCLQLFKCTVLNSMSLAGCRTWCPPDLQHLCCKESFVYSRSPDIIAVTETWLTDKILNNEILPKGYSITRKDRQSSGGGVLIAIKESKSYQVLSSPPDLELLAINTDSITYCLVYIPPNSSHEYVQKYLDFITSLNNTFNNLVTLTLVILTGSL